MALRIPFSGASIRKYLKLSNPLGNVASFRVCQHATASGWTGTMADLTIDEEKGYGTLVMKNPTGNALATPLIQEMIKAVADVEKSKCRGLVLTSSVKNIFCSGLNIIEFGGPGTDLDIMAKYYAGFQDLWFNLFKSRLITIAAMNGSAIAGGCALAMACDYRIFATPNFAIGMSEVVFGVEVPYFLLDVMTLIIGWQNSSKAALSAKLHSSDEAIKVGLVDELCSLDEMNSRVEKVMADYLKVNQKAQEGTKLDSRQNLIDKFLAIKEKDLARVVATVNDPQIWKLMMAYLESFKKPKN